jgi:hypothetical protein
MKAESRSLRGRLASASAAARRDPSLEPKVDDLRREFRTERLAEHIEKALATAPPLTDSQRVRLAALLAPFVGAT